MTSSRGLELINAATDTMRQIRVLYADLLDIVSDMDREETARDAGYTRTATLLAAALHITPRRASRMLAQADQVTERITPTGHTTPAPLPTLREALREGVIDGDHIDMVAETIKQLPAWASRQDRALIETTLAATARTDHPLVVRDQGEVLLAHVDQDGTHPHEEQRLAEPVNTFRYKRTRDGRILFTGDLEPEIAETFEALLGVLAKPAPVADGVPDPRSKRQRLGDAVSDIIDRAATATNLPAHGGLKPQLNVFLDLTTLLDGVGAATLESGSPLSPSAARRLACDAGLIPMVLGGNSVPLDLGRTRRLVTPGQRRALIARDKGCAFPGCPTPARWADAHHIRHWLTGGPTDLHNLVLLCRRHHRLLHHSEWTVTTHNGHPEFTPPRWVDHQQHPRRNTLHTPPHAA